jgi:hypothetical protein
VVLGDCDQAGIFAATSTAFVEPTPRELALGLNAVTYGGSPISVVLRDLDSEPTVAASYTVVNEEGRHAFPDGLVPEAVPAWVEDDEFGNIPAQEEGWLLVEIDSQPLELPLHNLRLSVSTEADCSRGTMTLSGVVWGSESDVWQDAVAGGQDVEPPDEVQDEDRVVDDVTVSAIFTIERVDAQAGQL